MFRKIHSNRPPEKTVWADLMDVLAPYIKKINHSSSNVSSRFPKTIFTCMIIALMFSVLWPFIYKQSPARTGIAVESKKDYSIQNPPAVAKGLNSISRAAGDLKRIITIRETVDSVLNKKMLSQADSVFLENALLELKLIQQP